MIFVKALGNRIYDETAKKFKWWRPCMYNGTSWVDMHTYVYTNGDWVKLPNWKPAVTRPTSAMTSNSSAKCVASSSSQNSSTYAAWRAFNKVTDSSTSWVSSTSDKNPWIQLKMDISLKDIVVTIVNRTSGSAYVGGLINGSILGSDDGSTWTTICSISGRDGGTSGASTTHICNNSEDSYQYVRIAFTKWSGTSFACVGEIYIDGNVEK